jgi:hypothetical protein
MRRAITTDSSQAKASIYTCGHAPKLLTSPHQKSQSPLCDKPLPSDKPLPPRPIARLSNMPSPRKDSRGLIDASDRPLQVNTPTGIRNWPTLTPQSGRPKTATLEHDTIDPDAEAIAIAVSATIPSPLVAGLSDLANVDSAGRSLKQTISSHSSQLMSSSYDVTPKYEPSRKISKIPSLASRQSFHSRTPAASATPRPSVGEPASSTPSRSASLRNRISSGSLVAPPAGSRHQVVGFTDFTKVRYSTSNTVFLCQAYR